MAAISGPIVQSALAAPSRRAEPCRAERWHTLALITEPDSGLVFFFLIILFPEIRIYLCHGEAKRKRELPLTRYVSTHLVDLCDSLYLSQKWKGFDCDHQRCWFPKIKSCLQQENC